VIVTLLAMSPFSIEILTSAMGGGQEQPLSVKIDNTSFAQTIITISLIDATTLSEYGKKIDTT